MGVHQVKTTANLLHIIKLFPGLRRGLNFQIEHHLFPVLVMLHYPASKIVKRVCEAILNALSSTPTIGRLSFQIHEAFRKKAPINIG
jgi:fatty acid desaturase